MGQSSMKPRSAALAGAIWMLLTVPVQAQDQKATVAEVQELVTLLKLDKLMEASIPLMNKQMSQLMAKMVPNAKPDDLAEVNEMMGQVFQRLPAEFVKLAVPLYVENPNAEEVKGLVTFYKSPVGRSVIEKLPKLAQQGKKIGAVLGEQPAKEAFRDSRKRLREKGYQL